MHISSIRSFDSERGIFIDETDFSLFKAFDGGIRPPVCQRTVFIVVSSVLVECMTDFVACNGPKSAKIEIVKVIWILAPGKESGWLKNTSREDNLI